MYMNKLIISKYKLIVANMYSSGDKVCINNCVSNMMNKQNINAPPKHNTISNICD